MCINNYPNLKLAGVVLADTALHLPDFRAQEKTFALITQVAGRAGRFFPGGKVIVQSYSPDRDAINYAVKGLTEEFYKNELEARKVLNFPPYSRLLRLVFRSQKQDAAQDAAKSAFNILNRSQPQGTDILGPAECPLEMVNGNFRHQILLRSKQIRPLQEMAKNLVWGFRAPKDVYIEIDTDPISLL